MSKLVTIDLERLDEALAEHASDLTCMECGEDLMHGVDEVDLELVIQAMEVPPWQPIETAPKDRTSILAWWPTYHHHPFVCYFDNKNGFVWKGTIGSVLSFKGDPDKWMPLPEPPKESE